VLATLALVIKAKVWLHSLDKINRSKLLLIPAASEVIHNIITDFSANLDLTLRHQHGSELLTILKLARMLEHCCEELLGVAFILIKNTLSDLLETVLSIFGRRLFVVA
jgi:hypothetical protein